MIINYLNTNIKKIINMKTLDIVVPCYNEEEMLPIFYKEVSNNLKNINWNVIFVNDGSNFFSYSFEPGFGALCSDILGFSDAEMTTL